ncbi:hypothetical protein [Clostridium botulinum]|uniref:hypothetical protein n=1 Tax=Clostridium botulinum TaxID=1491 RepID=UPI00016BA6B2|nr:hypothetical protein [Clostridium botulinum]APC80428.1 hypothetical protein NPD2_3062 [Clostridium botulinum]APC84909.1 hypothetical protein NPD12_911 [Clostridium botulinum]AXG95906.1 hypothetical protein AGE31_09570 [Clostridium botulinum]EDT83052.1 hypothetical protein CBN_0781 [Clostridium botulinum NCTC 2916]MBY6771963.1 hypothetical protein [Clostridium botulinum]
MKKYFSLTIIVLLVLVLLWIKPMEKLIPLVPPNINITYNQNKIEVVKGDYTWTNKPGNSNLADSPINLAKKLKASSVEKGEQIKFTFNTLLRQPSKTSINLVIYDKDNPSDIKLKEQVVNANSFNAPKKRGEYIFLIYSLWDEGHSINYVFKINVI